MKVHHGLGRARADDAGEGPSLEGNHVFRGASRDDDRVGLDVFDGFADSHDDFLFHVNAHDGRVQDDVDAGLARFVEKGLADAESADFRLVFL